MDSEYVVKRVNKLSVLLVLFGVLQVGQVWAYPNYISYGYNTCMNCHFNPMGGGSLTDYGRAMVATEIADRQWKQSDEKVADQSGFFFGKPGNDWFRPQVNYRGLYYDSDPGKGVAKNEWINMDLSASLALKFFGDKLIMVGNAGYAPRPRASRGDTKTFQEFRTREHYIGYRFSSSFGVYAGLMDKAFGIRVPDHIVFSRSTTRLNQNDQTHGVLFHFVTENWELALQPFVGNMVQEADLRQKGGTVQVGRMIGQSTRIGGSYLQSSSEFLKTMMYSIDLRAGFGESNSLMLELGQVENSPKSRDKTTGRYVLLQNQWRLRRGLSSILTAEMLQPNIKESGEIYRLGPGIQYFPINRVELRADIYDTRQRSSAAYTDDSWMITGQVHVWF